MAGQATAELLRRHGIDYVENRSGKFTVDCPNCRQGYLNVKVERDRVVWFCHHCEEGGTEAFDGGDAKAGKEELGEIRAVYDYCDEGGTLLFQVLRFEPAHGPKQFRQRTSPQQAKWSIKGIRIVPYRLPELIEDLAGGHVVVVVEGEKDVDRLREFGVPATCNPMGAGKWWPAFNEILRGADVVVCGDHDAPGHAHVRMLVGQLTGIARRIRVLDLAVLWPAIEVSCDISDWFDHGGGTVELLWHAIEGLPDLTERKVIPLREVVEPSTPPGLRALDMIRWDHVPVPEPDWVVLNRIPRRQTALFSGEGAMGKSTLLLQLCAAHACAKDWLGTMPEPGPALFLDAEDDQDVMHRRLAAVVRHYGVSFTQLAKGGLQLISKVGEDCILATASRSGILMPTGLYNELYTLVRDVRPVMIGLASTANFFAGNENDRAQVQQFIGLMTRLAIAANGSVVLIAHPSNTGIASGSGISGSTQWHNAVRARFLLRGVRRDGGEPEGGEPDNDLREIEFKKNNYGPIAERLTLRWQDGLFLPERKRSVLDQTAQDSRDDDIFAALVRRFNQQNRNVSPNKGPTYAPALFAGEKEARAGCVNGARLKRAMERTLEAGLVAIEVHGPASRRRSKLVGGI